MAEWKEVSHLSSFSLIHQGGRLFLVGLPDEHVHVVEGGRRHASRVDHPILGSLVAWLGRFRRVLRGDHVVDRGVVVKHPVVLE